MKTLWLLTLLCVTRITVLAADGITFFQGNWAALLEAAQKQNKLIFVDVYTDWCPPCKQMDKEVLPHAAVGSKYNKDFISFKLNAEKGEGIALAKQYGVTAYPTYLYLDSKGRMLHRAVGFYEVNAFNTQADKAIGISKDPNLLGNLEDRYLKGDRDAAFLQTYIAKLTALGLDNSEPFNTWFKNTPVSTLTTEEALKFIGMNINSNHAFALPFFIARYDSLANTLKQQLAERLYPEVFRKNIMQSLEEKRYLEIPPLLEFADQLYINSKQREDLRRIRIIYFTAVKDVPRMKEYAYALAEEIMSVPLDSVKRENARKYAEVMAPFLSGQQDSTKIEHFQEERKMVETLYSREIGAKLYFVATCFADVLDKDDQSLKDALQWARHGLALNPGEKAYEDLVKRLKTN